jgi:hypothetical protein
VGKQEGRKEPRGGRGVVEFEATEGEGLTGEEAETKGWDRGSSSFSSSSFERRLRRLRLRLDGALWDGKMRIVDSTLPSIASDSRILYQSAKVFAMAELRASGEMLVIWSRSVVCC